MSTELELKYLIGAADVALLSELLQLYAKPAASVKHSLLNAYYDTADNWFRRHDMGLRTRQKNGCFEQTIKLAGQQHGALQIRPEYNVECAGVTPLLADFPDHIWPKATDVAQLQSQLIELFRTDFERQSWQLQLPNAKLDVVYDNGEVRAGDRRQAISEVEIELLEGEPVALFDLAAFLLQSMPMRTGWLSKAARGYQLYQRTTTARPHPLTASDATVLNHLQRLQQWESCYLQEFVPELLLSVEQEIHALAKALTDEGQQLLASDARAMARRLADEGGLVFNSKAYQLLLLNISKWLFNIA